MKSDLSKYYEFAALYEKMSVDERYLTGEFLNQKKYDLALDSYLSELDRDELYLPRKEAWQDGWAASRRAIRQKI